MDDFRPLREHLDSVVAGGQPGSDLAELAALPGDLFGEAVVGYSDTAPVEVAEHLEPFVTAVTAGETPDPAFGLELLAGAAPSASEGPEPAELFAEDLEFGAGGTVNADVEPALDVAEPGNAAEFEPAETADPTREGDASSWLDVSLFDPAGDEPLDVDGFGDAGPV